MTQHYGKLRKKTTCFPMFIPVHSDSCKGNMTRPQSKISQNNIKKSREKSGGTTPFTAGRLLINTSTHYTVRTP